MSPLNNNIDSDEEEMDEDEVGVALETRQSDMRRVSMSLAFSAARHRRRRHMKFINSWLRSKLGISGRRHYRNQ